jgi:hypothetical protein
MALQLPASMRPFSEAWRISGASRSGGQGMTGTQQFAASPSGRWLAKVSFHLLDDENAQSDARGFIAGLDGQFGTMMIGPTDWRGQPWAVDPLTGTQITPGLAARSAKLDPEYQSNAALAGGLVFSLAADVAMNATTISILRETGGPLRSGQYLQIGDRLHIIVGLASQDPVGDGGLAVPGVVDVRIRPWLRDDYPAGTVVNFANPKCVMRMADADQGDIESATSPLSDITLSLAEAF